MRVAEQSRCKTSHLYHLTSTAKIESCRPRQQVSVLGSEFVLLNTKCNFSHTRRQILINISGLMALTSADNQSESRTIG